MQLLDSTSGCKDYLTRMLFCLVESVGFIDFVKRETLLVDERFELALVDECSDLSEYLTLLFASNAREQWN